MHLEALGSTVKHYEALGRNPKEGKHLEVLGSTRKHLVAFRSTWRPLEALGSTRKHLEGTLRKGSTKKH